MIEKILSELQVLKEDAVDKWDGGASYRAYTKAIEIVQEVAKDGGWIPCSERLPSESERWLGHDIADAEPREFIVMVKGAYEPTTGYYTNNGWVKNIYYKEESGYVDEVIAWRFFPAPFQKGE